MALDVGLGIDTGRRGRAPPDPHSTQPHDDTWSKLKSTLENVDGAPTMAMSRQNVNANAKLNQKNHIDGQCIRRAQVPRYELVAHRKVDTYQEIGHHL